MIMKLLLFVSIMLMVSACADDPVVLQEPCGTYAVVEDYSTLDGCGYLLKTVDGEYLYPVWPLFCETPPVDTPSNPMDDFDYVHGKRVTIDFVYMDHYASICMKGRSVVINCIQEVQAEDDR